MRPQWGVGGGGWKGRVATGMGPERPHTAWLPLVFGTNLWPVPVAVGGSFSEGFDLVIFEPGLFLMAFSPPCMSVLVMQMKSFYLKKLFEGILPS